MNPRQEAVEAAVAAHRLALHEAGEALLALPLRVLPTSLARERGELAATRARLVELVGPDLDDELAELMEGG